MQLIRVHVPLRKKVILIRFRERDLLQLDESAKSLGVPSRSRLVNLALQAFFDSSAEQSLTLGAKRPVKIQLDARIKERLEEMARRLRASQAELVRIALHEFEQAPNKR